VKRSLIISAAVLVITLDAYAQNYYVKYDTNPRNGASATFMVNNFIAPQLQLAAGVVRNPSGEDVHILASHYTGYDRFSARTLHLVIDGEEIVLDTIIDSQRRRNNEIAGFQISEDVLRKLGTARNVRIALRGNWLIEKEIDGIHIERFAEFYTNHTR
jgi:hypothetical protein